MLAGTSSMRSSIEYRSGRRNSTRTATRAGSIASAVRPRVTPHTSTSRSPRASRLLRPRLAGPVDHVFVAGELLDTHRPAGMKAIGRYTDLRTHAEIATVRELGRGIVQHDGAVHALQKALSGGAIVVDDGIGMGRAIACDVFDGAVHA